MARPGVTYGDVAKACEKITSDGGKVSINSVRNMLGGTGSPNNLSKHIRTWKESITQTEDAADITLPESVVVSITNEIARSVEKAKAELQDELTSLQKEHAQVLSCCDELEAELQTAQKETSNSNDELQATKAVIAEKDGVIESLNDSLKTSQAQVEEHRANAEISRVELAKVLIKQEVLEKQVEGLAELRSQCSQSEKEAEVSQAKENAAYETIKRLEDAIQELKSKANQFEKEAHQSHVQLNTLRTELSICEKKHAVLEERLVKPIPEKQDKPKNSPK